MTNHDWYRTPIPGVDSLKPDFSRSGYDFYLNPKIDSVVGFYWKYPNYFILQDLEPYRSNISKMSFFMKASFQGVVKDVAENVVIQPNFANPKAGAVRKDEPCTNFDFKKACEEEGLHFDKNAMTNLFEEDIAKNPFIDIDFENQNHAFLYMPLMHDDYSAIRTDTPIQKAGEYKDWFPIDAYDVNCAIVGKFNLLEWKYEEGIWLMKKEFRDIGRKKVSIKESMSMLDFMMQ